MVNKDLTLFEYSNKKTQTGYPNWPVCVFLFLLEKREVSSDFLTVS